MAENATLSDGRDARGPAWVALRGLAYLALFTTGTGIGFLVWDVIRLPFHNPLNVSGPLTQIGFNPANNQVRFCLFVALPALLSAMLSACRIGPVNRLLFGWTSAGACTAAAAPARWLRTTLFAATLLFAALASLTVPTYHASGVFDNFHEGESLGTAVSLEHGRAPYEDVVFLHGLFQDPYRSMLAFRLFGRTIGATRALESAVKVAAWVLLATFLVLVFREDYRLAVPAFAALVLAQRTFSTFFYRHLIDKTFVCDPPVLLIVPSRDVLLMLFLIAAFTLYALRNRPQTPALAVGAAAFTLTFVAIGGFAYSVDRGFYLTAAAGVAVPVLYGLHFASRRARWLLPLAFVFGSAAALAVLGVLLDGRYGAFAQFVFREMPRYKELSDGYVFDISFLPYLRIALLYAFVTLWVAASAFGAVYRAGSLLRGTASFLDRYFMEFLLLIIALVYFRSALGRSDWEHIVYSALPVYLLTLLLVGKQVCRPLLGARWSAGTQTAIAIALILACGVLVEDTRRSGSARANFPVHVADEDFIPVRYRAAIEYLQANLAPDETVLALNSEASWYYFLDRPAPGRFPVVWFATTEPYQRELVKDIAAAPVKFVIFDGIEPPIDDIPHDRRYPILMPWLRQHYAPLVTLDGVEIWGRTR